MPNPLTSYQSFIHLSRYARFIDGQRRRERWDETVSRYVSYFKSRHPDVDIDWDEIYEAIVCQNVMPSMRALMTAGEALDRDNVAGYNCSYIAMDTHRAFSESLYILMCGTGVGFSVENQYIEQLPKVPKFSGLTTFPIIVEDSKDGWADAYRRVIRALYDGDLPSVDFSKIRPAGARLKTFGGRASGPGPLKDLVEFTVTIFQNAAGRKLRPIEVHDIMCKIGEVVVVGGVRRAALISLSDISDKEMATAKSGEWWKDNPQRALANNSAVHKNDISFETFNREWEAMVASGSGERGIFNRNACQIPFRRKRRDFGTNPCSEIVLRNKQFCNLTEVVVRADDDRDSLQQKVRIATILGTLQSGLDDLSKLSHEWGKNTREERLLGVSLTGICDNAFMSTLSHELSDTLRYLKTYAVEINRIYADRLGLEQSASVTCVKPSGTVSQLVDAASGIHGRFSKFYIRRVRMDSKDPLAEWLKNKGVPCEPDVMSNSSNLVFSFPVKSPENSKIADNVSALDQLELWLMYQMAWCEHKPSVTIYVGPDEWNDVRDWVWRHRKFVSGISFLPRSEHTYAQAPYESIDEYTYNSLIESMPDIDFETYREEDDNTTSSQQLACAGGACEIVYQ